MILYGEWPINPDNPGEAIQISQALEDLRVDWFPKNSLILVKISDMIRIWDKGELKLSPVFRRTTNGVLFSKDLGVTLQNPGCASIEVLQDRGVVKMEDGRITDWSGFKDKSVMLGFMKEFFDYDE